MTGRRSARILKKKTISAWGAMQRVRILAPQDPRKVRYNLAEAFHEAVEALEAVAMDRDGHVSQREADLALRLMLKDEAGICEFIAPALLTIARRYVRSAGVARR